MKNDDNGFHRRRFIQSCKGQRNNENIPINMIDENYENLDTR